MQETRNADGSTTLKWDALRNGLPSSYVELPLGCAIGLYLPKDEWSQIIEVPKILFDSELELFDSELEKGNLADVPSATLQVLKELKKKKKPTGANFSDLSPELIMLIRKRMWRKGTLDDLQRPASGCAIFECRVQPVSREKKALQLPEGLLALLSTHMKPDGHQDKLHEFLPSKQDLTRFAFYAPLATEFVLVRALDGYYLKQKERLKYASLPLLKSISRDNNLTECSVLEHIDLPRVTDILSATFEGCVNLVSVNAPRIITIEDDAFEGCAKLQAVGDVQHGSNKGVILPACTSIGDAFASCIELKRVRLPLVEMLSAHAFSKCTRIEEFETPAMQYITEGYLSLLIKPFKYCLRKIQINSVEEIPCRTFGYCHMLEEVQCESAQVIGPQAFDSCINLEMGFTLNQLKDMGREAFARSGIKSFSSNGPIEGVPARAFEGCTKLTSVSMRNVTNLEMYAFSGCVALKMVDLPLLDWDAFEGCTDLSISTEFFQMDYRRNSALLAWQLF